MKTLLIRLAWKNIWRSKLRSGIILGAIALGLFTGTFMASFITGWINNSVVTDIQNQLSYIQIHHPKYADDNDINAWYEQNEVANALQNVPAVRAATHRLRINGMLASAANATGVSVKGVDAEEEKAVCSLYECIPDSCGSFLEDGKMPIAISLKLAEKLKVRIKTKLVFTFQDTEGEMQSLAFRVSGIYKTTNSAFDESTVFVRKTDLLPVSGLPEGAIHETALSVDDFETAQIAAQALKSQLPNLEVQLWDEVQPELGLMFMYTDMMMIIILGIFLLALSFGIINTMLMAVLERTRELGMLGAIGMSKGRIFRMIMLETLCLTCVGSLVGIAIAAAIIGLTAHNGIDLTFWLEDQFEDYGFGSVVHPMINLKMFMQVVVLVVLTGILSAIYPARKALKLKSLEAIRK
jgi:ABC-type lipoprotein release transport system permease subunit